MSLLDKAKEAIHLSQELLAQGRNMESIVAAIQAARYIMLIKLLRTGEKPPHDL